MTDDAKYQKYKELLSEGYTKQAIGLELGYKGKTAGSSLNKFVKKYEAKIVIHSETHEGLVKKGVESNPVIADDKRGQLLAFFQEENNLEILKRIIEREKTTDDEVIPELLLIDDDILQGDNVRTTIRIDKIVDMEFSKFCHKNRHLAKYHIMSQALKEFLKKYGDE